MLYGMRIILMIKPVFNNFFIIVFLVALPGCASLNIANIFQGYSQQMKPVKLAQHQGNFTKAQTLLNDQIGKNSQVLGLLEKGRLQFLAHDWPASQRSFEKAYQLIEIERNKAKIQLSRGVEKLGAVISNDNAISYQVSYYEQSMLHSYQALNYLFQHDIEGALVEIRRANLVQENALKQYQGEIHSAQEKLYNSGMSTESLGGKYPSMADNIGQVKNGFQNAFTFYLSGILYEASGELNDAYIDYKRAIEIYPDNHYLQQDVLRLASTLGMNDDLDDFQKRFGTYKPQTLAEHGQVVVLFEQGIVSSKDDISLNLPVHRSNGDIKFLSFSLPVYRDNLPQNRDLVIDSAGEAYESSEIVRIQSLAAKALQEQLPSLLTRQVLRVLAKEQVRQKLSREAGDVGNILASIYNIASEKADTRSWSTLADEVDILRLNLPIGQQTLNVLVNGQQKNIDVNVQQNRITLINFTAIGSFSDYQTINL